jgi:catechol 2,3-dioxygenase-like lactoylglutathione lyase family enzyme
LIDARLSAQLPVIRHLFLDPTQVPTHFLSLAQASCQALRLAHHQALATGEAGSATNSDPANGAAVSGGPQTVIAAAYVHDLDASRRFYEVMGFSEVRSGASPKAAWSELASGGYKLLLVATSPPLAVPSFPLLFYFFYADLAAQTGALHAAGLHWQHLGHPAHAPGGEINLTDPDGNTVLAGQRHPAPAAELPPGPPEERFSLLKEAAAAAAQRSSPGIRCQVSGEQWAPCGAAGELRIADSAGDTVWVCLAHADEILVSVPGTFITSAEVGGIAAFLANRQR